jgi:hypothetical protein
MAGREHYRRRSIPHWRRVDRTVQWLTTETPRPEMVELLVRITLVIGAGVLWFAGLRLFLQSELPRTRKVGWTAVLIVGGIGIGVVLPLGQLWNKFLVLILILPVLGLVDVLLLKFGRGLSFWIRACGFEVCTVFGTAAVARVLLDLVRAAVLVPAVN